MLAVLKGVRCMLLCILKVVEVVSCVGGVGGAGGARGRALCPGGREGRATCAEVVGGCALYAGGSEWCTACAIGAGGRALYAVLYSGGRGGECTYNTNKPHAPTEITKQARTNARHPPLTLTPPQ